MRRKEKFEKIDVGAEHAVDMAVLAVDKRRSVYTVELRRVEYDHVEKKFVSIPGVPLPDIHPGKLYDALLRVQHEQQERRKQKNRANTSTMERQWREPGQKIFGVELGVPSRSDAVSPGIEALVGYMERLGPAEDTEVIDEPDDLGSYLEEEYGL